MVFSSPLYFMNVPGRGKALIDRCQAFWSAKYMLKLDLFGGRKRFGFLITCAGKKFGKGSTPVFRGIEDTMKTLFSALSMNPLGNLLVSGVDNKGDISGMPAELDRAYEAGRKMAKLLKENGIE
jgi:multimeric flavodoxin WrbA